MTSPLTRVVQVSLPTSGDLIRYLAAVLSVEHGFDFGVLVRTWRGAEDGHGSKNGERASLAAAGLALLRTLWYLVC